MGGGGNAEVRQSKAGATARSRRNIPNLTAFHRHWRLPPQAASPCCFRTFTLKFAVVKERPLSESRAQRSKMFLNQRGRPETEILFMAIVLGPNGALNANRLGPRGRGKKSKIHTNTPGKNTTFGGCVLFTPPHEHSVEAGLSLQARFHWKNGDHANTACGF